MSIDHTKPIANLAAAFVKAQGQLKNPPKDSNNPHFKSKYADLPTVLDTVRPVLAANNLAVLQTVETAGTSPVLTTTLLHASGESIEATVVMLLDKSNAQGFGSALTYYRRYALCALLGIAGDDDDDGNAATHPPKQAVRQVPQKQLPAASQPPNNPGAFFNQQMRAFQDAMTPGEINAANGLVKAKAEWLNADQLSQLRAASKLATDRIGKPKAPGGQYQSPPPPREPGDDGIDDDGQEIPY